MVNKTKDRIFNRCAGQRLFTWLSKLHGGPDGRFIAVLSRNGGVYMAIHQAGSSAGQARGKTAIRFAKYIARLCN